MLKRKKFQKGFFDAKEARNRKKKERKLRKKGSCDGRGKRSATLFENGGNLATEREEHTLKI